MYCTRVVWCVVVSFRDVKLCFAGVLWFSLSGGFGRVVWCMRSSVSVLP